MATNPELLRDIVLLQTMDDEERASLASVMEEVRFPNGHLLFKECDEGGICYIIGAGWVELSVIDDLGEKVVVDILGPGELFGELSLLDGGKRSTSAHALSDVDAVALKRSDFLDFLRKKPDASLDILSALAKRLRNADALLKQRVQDPNKLIEEKITLGDRLADSVASFGGSWRFIIVFALITIVWMAVNSAIGAPFDPYPFILLNLVLSTLAAVQAPVILMSQNRQDTKDRIRAEADYHVNVKAEAEITQLHEKVDKLRVELNLKLESLSRRLPRSTVAPPSTSTNARE
jgi:uncharacterized membrane protein